MDNTLLHIFRNTPLGRETLLQSLYFCSKIDSRPIIYIPQSNKFLMYFEHDVVQIDLDNSYLTSPDTAVEHATHLLKQEQVQPNFFKPKNYTASTLPDIPTNFDFMCCPRSVSDLASKIGLGHIGPRVRRIVQSAKFPVLITSPVFKKWKSIAVFFGGSSNAVKALKLGLWISEKSGMPLDIFTQIENSDSDSYKNVVKNEGIEEAIKNNVRQWRFFDKGKFEENIYDVPHDTLVVLGAYGHGLIKDLFFGSKMEKIQTTISNNLLITGPNCTFD